MDKKRLNIIFVLIAVLLVFFIIYLIYYFGLWQNITGNAVSSSRIRGFSYPYNSGWLSFPTDEGKHRVDRWPFVLMEWFANYGHITADDGSKYSYFITYVTYDPLEDPRLTALGARLDLPIGTSFFPHKIFTLVDEQNQTIYTTGDYTKLKKFESEKADVETGTGDILRWKGRRQPFQYDLTSSGFDSYSGTTYSVDLDLKMAKSPLVLNGIGYIRQPLGVSGYYSQTKVEVDGKLIINGIEKHVKGINWIDRQWLGASFGVNAVSNSYEWWAVQLDNNEDAIIYRIWNTRDRIIASEILEINHADGKREKITDYSLENLDYWTSPNSGRKYSSGWHLTIPSKGWDLIITPIFKDQEAKSPFSFWEGTSNSVVGVINNKNVTGVATAELLYSYDTQADARAKDIGAVNLRSLPQGSEKVKLSYNAKITNNRKLKEIPN